MVKLLYVSLLLITLLLSAYSIREVNAYYSFNKNEASLIINLSSIKTNNSILDAFLHHNNISKTPSGPVYLKPPAGYNATFFENEIKEIKNKTSKNQIENLTNNTLLKLSTPCGTSKPVYSNLIAGTNSKSPNSLHANLSVSNVIATGIFNCPMIKSRTNLYNSNLSSYNWAGYVTTVNTIANPASDITAINGSWIVQAASKSNNTVYSSQWIGIGGFNDSTLIQTGTSSDYSPSQLANSSYYAWYELLPAGESELLPSKYPVSPNDIIRADIRLVNSSSNLWNITISDLNISRKWTFSTLVNYNSSKASAEVIEERPEISSLFFYSLSNLSDFGVSNFGALYTKQNYTSYVTEGGANMSFGSFSHSSITMLTNSGDQAYASPFGLKDGTSFKVMYGPFITPAPASVDTGTQSIKFLLTAGGGPYDYNWSDNNSIIGTNSNTLTFHFNSTTNSIKNIISVSIFNTTNHSLITKSMPDPISFNPSLKKPIISLSANVADSNEYFYLNSSVSGGTSPYLYNFSIYNKTNSNSLVSSKSFFWGNTISMITFISNPGNYFANVIVTDSASPPSTNSSADTNSIKINPLFEINSISSTSSHIDLGENNSIKLVANLSGGTGPFNLSIASSLNYSTLIASNSINFNITNGNSIHMTIPITSTGTYYSYIKGSDLGTSTPFIISQSNTTIVSTALTKPNLTIKNPILDQGQALSLYYYELNGTLPYTYNVLLYDYSSNTLYKSFISQYQPSFVLNPPISLKNGTYYAKIIVNDSASPPESSNSPESQIITVNKSPEIKLTPNLPSIANGNTETITISMYNGTGPFNVELLNASSNKEIGSRNLTISSGSNNTLSFTVLAPRGGIIDLKAIATDQGTSIPYLFNSSITEIDINPIYQAPSISISNASSIGEWFSYNSSTNSIGMSIPTSTQSTLGNIYTLFSSEPPIPLNAINSESFTITSYQSQNIIGFNSQNNYGQSPNLIMLVKLGNSNNRLLKLESNRTLFTPSGINYTGSASGNWLGYWYYNDSIFGNDIKLTLPEWSSYLDSNYTYANITYVGIDYGAANSGSSGTIYLDNLTINHRVYSPAQLTHKSEVPMISSPGYTQGNLVSLNSLNGNSISFHALASNFSSEPTYTIFIPIGAVLNQGLLDSNPDAAKTLQSSLPYAFPSESSPYSLGNPSIIPSPFAGASGIPEISNTINYSKNGGGLTYSSFSSNGFENMIRLSNSQLPSLLSNNGLYDESQYLWVGGFSLFDQQLSNNTGSLAILDPFIAYQISLRGPIYANASAYASNKINPIKINMLGYNWTVINASAPSSNMPSSSNFILGGNIILTSLFASGNLKTGQELSYNSSIKFELYSTNGTQDVVKIYNNSNLINTTILSFNTPTKIPISQIPYTLFITLTSSNASTGTSNLSLTARLKLVNGTSVNGSPKWFSLLRWSSNQSSPASTAEFNANASLVGIIIYSNQTNFTEFNKGFNLSILSGYNSWKIGLAKHTLLGNSSRSPNNYQDNVFASGAMTGFYEFLFPYSNPALGFNNKTASTDLYGYSNASGFNPLSKTQQVNDSFLIEPLNLFISDGVGNNDTFSIIPPKNFHIENSTSISVLNSSYLLYNLDTYSMYSINSLSSSAIINLSKNPNYGIVATLVNKGINGNFINSNANLSIGLSGYNSISSEVSYLSFNSFGSNATKSGILFKNISEILLNANINSSNRNILPPYPGVEIKVYDTSNTMAPQGNSILLGILNYSGPYLLYNPNINYPGSSSYLISFNAISTTAKYNAGTAYNASPKLSIATPSKNPESVYFNYSIPQSVYSNLGASANIIIQLRNASYGSISNYTNYLTNNSLGSDYPFGYQSSQGKLVPAKSGFITESGGEAGTYYPNNHTSYFLNALHNNEMIMTISPTNPSYPSNLKGFELLFNGSYLNTLSNITSISYSFHSNSSTAGLIGLNNGTALSPFPVIIFKINNGTEYMLRPEYVNIYSENTDNYSVIPKPNSWTLLNSNGTYINYPISYLNSTPLSLYDWYNLLESHNLNPEILEFGINYGFEYLQKPYTISINNLTVNNITYGMSYQNKTPGKATYLISIPSHSNAIINFTQNTYLNLSNTYANNTVEQVSIANITTSSLPAISNKEKLLILNISATYSSNPNITTNAIIGYSCNIPTSKISPYILTNGTWSEINSYSVSSSKCNISFNIPEDPIIGIFETTSSSSPSSSSGGGGGATGGSSGSSSGSGAGGGGGTFKPSVINLNSTCYLVTNLTNPDFAVVNFTGKSFNIRANYISPTGTGITIDGLQYTLSPNSTEIIGGTASYDYIIRLLNISYIPAVHTIASNICVVPLPGKKILNVTTLPNMENTGRSTTLYNTTNNNLSIIINSTKGHQSIINYEKTLSVFSINSTKGIPSSTLLSITNSTQISSAPPSNYTKLYALNITYSQDSNLSIHADLHYSCSTPQNETFPFEYSGNAWKMITNFNINSKLCTISFQVPGDLLIALMGSNIPKILPSSKSNTSKIIATSIKKVQNNSIPTNTSIRNSGTGEFSILLALLQKRNTEISIIVLIIAMLLIYIIYETKVKEKNQSKGQTLQY